jgi:hypothetical protein
MKKSKWDWKEMFKYADAYNDICLTEAVRERIANGEFANENEMYAKIKEEQSVPGWKHTNEPPAWMKSE